MALWGASANNEKKPEYLTDEEKRDCYATEQGWVYKQPDGTEEILVAIGNLEGSNSSTGIGAPQVTEIYLTTRESDDANVVLNVIWNEKVYVETDIPYIQLTGNAEFTGDGKADFVISSNGSNETVFTYVPVAGDNVGELVLDTDINLNGGTIKDGSNTDAILSIDTAGANGSVDVRPDLTSESVIVPVE